MIPVHSLWSSSDCDAEIISPDMGSKVILTLCKTYRLPVILSVSGLKNLVSASC
ncbi:MAG: hypothetical protein KAJ54_00915 [Candidatus Aenigmarchaeota archaeon]|nr:hypothetical protein [Candidatus Aenigmarchaeota archaeon]